MRLYIVVLFVGDQLLHHFSVFYRNAAVDQFVQNGHHFRADHGAAFQQNFADGEDLAVGQPLWLCMGQTVAPLRPVIENILRQLLLH